MKHIQSNHTNARLICSGLMLNSHNRSDCRQIAGVFLEHTHPANTALSSPRGLSMQGFALFHAYFAGRCNNQSIHPAAVAHSTRLTYFLTALSLAYGWLDANHKSVSLVLLGKPLDGGSPEEPSLAPVAAIRRIWAGEALAQAEIMEAYAVQALAVIDGAGLDPQVVNPGGGGLARGHPIGASGAILAVRLYHGLHKGRGLAAIAAAGGIGTALLVEASGA